MHSFLKFLSSIYLLTTKKFERKKLVGAVKNLHLNIEIITRIDKTSQIKQLIKLSASFRNKFVFFSYPSFDFATFRTF